MVGGPERKLLMIGVRVREEEEEERQGCGRRERAAQLRNKEWKCRLGQGEKQSEGVLRGLKMASLSPSVRHTH